MNEFALKMLESGYLQAGETPKQLRWRVANAGCPDSPERALRIVEYMEKDWFSPATPVLTNLGTDRGLPISCYKQKVGDSKEALAQSWNELFWLGSEGGGIGTDYDDVRELGASIRGVGQSGGVIPFGSINNAYTGAMSQGSVRKAANAIFMKDSHPEFKEFMITRKPTGGDLRRKWFNIHHGAVLTDEFMNAVVNVEQFALRSRKDGSVVGSVDAFDTFASLLDTRVQTGEPYIVFYDNVNKHLPELYKKAGYEIHNSNLCVAPETLLLTDKGYIPINSLKDQTVNVWNGEEFTSTVVRQTGSSQELLKITFSNGSVLEVTPYHKFYIIKEYGTDIGFETKAQDLVVGNALEPFKLPNETYYVHVYVTSIEHTGRVDDTYCLTEEKLGKVVFNGIRTGNCVEIMLHTSETKTAVCCLASVNLVKFDEWKDDTLFIEDVAYFLDGVLDEFVAKINKMEGLKKLAFEKALNFVLEERSIGIGVAGWHDYLQKNNIPFESSLAISAINKIHSHIKEKADAANVVIAEDRGSCELAKRFGEKKRFALMLAIAPTSSISIIMGVISEGILPRLSNLYMLKNKTGLTEVRNPYLDNLLKRYQTAMDKPDEWVEQQWSIIRKNSGSVQSLQYLSDWEKDVFKTAYELDQHWMIEHAAARQPYIDQSQSVNLFFSPTAHKKYILDVHLAAWKKGVKTLYYCRSENIGKSSLQTREEKVDLSVNKYEECLSCQ